MNERSPVLELGRVNVGPFVPIRHRNGIRRQGWPRSFRLIGRLAGRQRRTRGHAVQAATAYRDGSRRPSEGHRRRGTSRRPPYQQAVLIYRPNS